MTGVSRTETDPLDGMRLTGLSSPSPRLSIVSPGNGSGWNGPLPSPPLPGLPVLDGCCFFSCSARLGPVRSFPHRAASTASSTTAQTQILVSVRPVGARPFRAHVGVVANEATARFSIRVGVLSATLSISADV